MFAAVADASPEAWGDLAATVGPGGTAILFRGEPVDPPGGWVVDHRGEGHQMVGPIEVGDGAAGLGARRLGPEDLGEMMALVALTEPGPFEERTVELGRYLGVFDDRALVAMAGERMHLPGHTEISAVCTHPSARGRGLAAALVREVAAGIAGRDEVPFLHVAASNHGARSLYERLGFRHRRPVSILVTRAPGGPEEPVVVSG